MRQITWFESAYSAGYYERIIAVKIQKDAAMNYVFLRNLPDSIASPKTVTWATSLLRKFKRRISDQEARCQFERESKRLLVTSPHLLKDIGLVPAFEPQRGMQQVWKSAPERPDIKLHIGGNRLVIQERENSFRFDRPSVI